MLDDPRLSPGFWARVSPEPNTGCWIWTGSTKKGRPGHGAGGYGHFSVGERRVQTHRYAYEQLRGPIPKGLTIDHLCRTVACCNPDHLEPVTLCVNLLRGDTFQARNAAKTHCPQGHELSGANLMNRKSRPNERECLACHRARCRRYREKTRGGVGNPG